MAGVRAPELSLGRMDRRRFFRNAGLVAAGSALGGSPLGCAADEVYLAVPCLAEAMPPAALSHAVVLTASQIGCTLDCDLGTGRNKHTGGAATDDAPRINAAMAGATAAQPITLILDGAALISGLFLPAGGYWSIQGQGCTTGFFVKAGTNNDGIHNGGPLAAVPSDPGPAQALPARGSSVSLTNFVLNGNAGKGLDGDSTTGMPQGSTKADLYYFGINLMNLDNIVIENVVVLNSPSYHIRLSNVGNVMVSGCVTDSTGPNTDGLHVDGPANDIGVANCNFTCGDDGIALNCPEGYTGNISGVTVTGCTFNSLSLMRLYTGLGPGFQFKIDAVTVSQCSGTVSIAAFLIGTYANDVANADVALSVSNCQLTAPAVLDMTTDFSTIALSGVTLIPANGPNNGYAFARSYFQSTGRPYRGASLSFADCVIQRNGNYPVAALIVDSGSSIASVEFNGFSVQDAGGSYAAAPALLNLVSGTIGQLAIDSVSSAHLDAPVSPGGFSSVGSVSGAGVLATGWTFPDAVMANGTPYLSAASGVPSIKVGGVVEAYP